MDDQLKKDLKVNLIVTLATVLLIQPIINGTGRALVWLGEHLNTFLSQQIYRSAAEGFNEYYSFQTWAMGLGILMGMYAAIGLIAVRRRTSNSVASRARWKAVATSRWRVGVALPMALVVLFFCLYQFSVHSAAHRLNSSFHQRLTVLAPSISDQEEEELRAQWASMRGVLDYDALNGAMATHAAKYGVTLPRPYH